MTIVPSVSTPAYRTPPGAGGTAPNQPYAHHTRRLLNSVLTGVPRRIAVMRETGDRKYQDLSGVDRDTFLRPASDHLAGKRTIAATLADAGGMARAGCRDYDAGGEAALLAALASDVARGITSFAILMPGEPHPGGHVWRFYDRPCPAADIRADLARLPGAPGEVYPSGNVIRLPFGFHRRKRTRGVLILQDGRRFNLDDPDELRSGIAAMLALPRNAPPPPAPAGADHASSGGAWGEHHQPDAWTNLPDGAALWNSSRIRAVARHRSQLATLLNGGKVSLMRDGAPDASASAQVASLVYNLMGANFPEDEVRAVADFLHARLRPDKSKDHYRAHVDAEIARYRPRNYQPEPTRFTEPPAPAPDADARRGAPAPLPPAQHVTPKPARGRPAAQPGGPGGYLTWLIEQAGPGGMLLMSQAECARACGVSLATVKRYERALKAAGLIERDPFNRRQAGRVIITVERGDNITVERGVKNHADVVSSSAGDVVSANCAAPHSDAENQNAGALHG